MSGIFGWSYPPGCSSRDVDEALGVESQLHPAEEEIGEILESAEVSQDVIDRVVEQVGAICDRVDQAEAAAARSAQECAGLAEQVTSLTRERDVLRERLEMYVPPAVVAAMLARPDQPAGSPAAAPPDEAELRKLLLELVLATCADLGAPGRALRGPQAEQAVVDAFRRARLTP